MSDEHFVRVWVNAYKNNVRVSKIAKQFGVSKWVITSRAYQLRKRGVPLPKIIQPKGGWSS